MPLPTTANVLDLEHDQGRIIEIGYTTVDIENLRILKSYSLPIPVSFKVSKQITQLTGWSTQKLQKSGGDNLNGQLLARLQTRGFVNRLIVVDQSDEIPLLNRNIALNPDFIDTHPLYADLILGQNSYDVSMMAQLAHPTEKTRDLHEILALYGLKFEGKQHRAKDDSYNIARVFLAQLIEMRAGAVCSY